MGERGFRARYKYTRQYADAQAEKYSRGEKIDEWAYERDYQPGMVPEPPRIRLTGAAWVAHAYDIAADAAGILTSRDGSWQSIVEECKHLAETYRKERFS